MSPSSIKSNYPQMMNPNKLSKGFTLIEVMITIAVAAVIMTIAVPSLGEFVVKMRVDNEVSQLNRLVLSARNNAITQEQNVIVCPLENGVCTANWQNEITAFIDEDNNGIYNNDGDMANLISNDTLIKVKAASKAGDNIIYAGQVRIGFAPTGILSPAIAGNFIYCPRSDSNLARAIALSISGRTYLTGDADNDGKDEFRNNGGDVSDDCPP